MWSQSGGQGQNEETGEPWRVWGDHSPLVKAVNRRTHVCVAYVVDYGLYIYNVWKLSTCMHVCIHYSP